MKNNLRHACFRFQTYVKNKEKSIASTVSRFSSISTTYAKSTTFHFCNLDYYVMSMESYCFCFSKHKNEGTMIVA